LVFLWTALQRQVRVRGAVAQVARETADAYFASRPLGSQWSAWASPQSQRVAGRADLEARLQAAQAKFGEAPPRPPHWGGYRLQPRTVEFWQGRANRLHDRLRYLRSGEGWQLERLAP
jgi:pyridoxamine 5'-phosphate oxidase